MNRQEVIRTFLVPIAALICASVSSASDAIDPKSCPPPRVLTPDETIALKEDLSTEVFTAKGNLKIGVDALGRFVVAVDSTKDGISDQLILFTDQDRLTGPWSKDLRDATIVGKKGSILISSKRDSYGVSLAVSVAEPDAVPSWAQNSFIRSKGRELVRSWGEAGVAMAALDYGQIESWPKLFWDDLHDNRTQGHCGGGQGQCCDTTGCISGGNPSMSCTIGGCGSAPTSCSVSGCTGTNPDSFSCCNCEGPPAGAAGCRCKQCTCGNCP
jgi:hypothetical protein